MAAIYYIKFAIFLVLGGFFLAFFWPLGLVFGYFALMAFAEAKDTASGIERYDETIIPVPKQGRSMEFGPLGPPWGDREPPLVLEGVTIFASSIQKITEWGAVGPEKRVWKGVERPVPGTARPAHISVQLHSGDSFSARGNAADRLSTWFHRVAVALPPLSQHQR